MEVGSWRLIWPTLIRSFFEQNHFVEAPEEAFPTFITSPPSASVSSNYNRSYAACFGIEPDGRRKPREVVRENHVRPRCWHCLDRVRVWGFTRISRTDSSAPTSERASASLKRRWRRMIRSNCTKISEHRQMIKDSQLTGTTDNECRRRGRANGAHFMERTWLPRQR